MLNTLAITVQNVIIMYTLAHFQQNSVRNNNNIISKTMFMVLSSWQSHCKSSPGSNGCRPKTKPEDLDCESTCTGCQNLHPPLPFIIITDTVLLKVS